MSIRDYKDGMKADARANSDFLKKQSDALNQLANDNKVWRDKYGNIIEEVVSDLSDKEKKNLYGINTVADIADVDRSEQEYLVAMLQNIANKYTKPETEVHSENQRGYIRSVKKYLQFSDVQCNFSFDGIENIDSRNAIKAMLQVVMEYLYLEKNDHSYYKTYKEIFDSFSVKESIINEIQGHIDAFCRSVGVTGLAEKYSYKTIDIQDNTTKKEPTTFEITIIASEIESDQKFARSIKASLENLNNNCKIVSIKEYEYGIKQADWKIFIGPNETSNTILNYGENKTIYSNKYGCELCKKETSNVLVVNNNKEIYIRDRREEFIKLYTDLCVSTTVKNEEINKMIAEKPKDAPREPEIAKCIINTIVDTNVNMCENENILVKAAGILTFIPSVVTVFTLGVATGIAEITTNSIVHEVENSNFDSRFIELAQRDILLVKLVEFIVKEQNK